MRLFGANEQYANGGSSEMRVSEGSILMFWKDEGFTSHGAVAFFFLAVSYWHLLSHLKTYLWLLLWTILHIFVRIHSLFSATLLLYFILHQPVRPGST